MKDTDGRPFIADQRAFQHSALQVIYYFFARLHDSLAQDLAVACPSLTPTQIFNRAKLLNTYILQDLWYGDILGLIIGANSITTRRLNTDIKTFDPAVQPVVFSEFACGASHGLRRYHPDETFLADANYVRTSTQRFRFSYFNIDQAKQQELPVLRGLLTQPIKPNGISDEVSRFGFFKSGFSFGQDLIATAIQRGRDCCLKPYTAYLRLFSNTCINAFTNLATRITNNGVTAAQQVYKEHNDMDLLFGGLLEPQASGALFGPTFVEIYGRQYEALKHGDPKFLTHKLNPDQLLAIRSLQLSDLLCVAFGLSSVPRDARFPVSASNPVIACRASHIDQVLDLSLFCSGDDCV